MVSASAYPPPHVADPAVLTRYWRASGIAFAVLAGLGILLVAIGRGDMLGGFLGFDTAHNVVHAALAVVSLAMGFGAVEPALARNMARGFGLAYLAVALLGFASADLFGLGRPVGLRIEAGENVLHLVLGAWGAWVGFRA